MQTCGKTGGNSNRPFIPANDYNEIHYDRSMEWMAGIIGSNVPWLDCPVSYASTWVITVTESSCMVLLWPLWEINMQADNLA